LPSQNGKSPSGYLSVGLAAVRDAGNLNRAIVFVVEQHPILAAPQSEAFERRPKLLDISGPRQQKMVHAVEDVQSGLAIL